LTNVAEKPYAIGIDLGGTKILAAVVELATGRVVSSAKKRTVEPSKDAVDYRLSDSKYGKAKDKDRDKDKDKVKDKDRDKDRERDYSKEGGPGGQVLMARVRAVMEEALDAAGPDFNTDQIGGIGLGVAGQVDRAKGVLLAAPNLGVSGELHIDDILEDEFKLPVAIGNDVEVATLGELKFGAGQACSNFVCVFVGTGIGGGIVQNGVPYRGTTNTAGEVGHMVIMAGGRFCGCGGLGHLEAYSSRTAITRSILAELKRGRPSVLREQLALDTMPDPTRAPSIAIRSKAIAKAIAADDELVISVVNEAADYLAYGLASVINLYNPQRLILGGGLIEAVDPFFERVVKGAKREALSVPAANIEIVRTKLGDFSGVVGAALLTRH
jgi:glucokinase